ncbi:MAG: YHYH protein [Bacteroidota bacterium]
MPNVIYHIFLACILLSIACTPDPDETPEDPETPVNNAELPAAFDNFTEDVSVYVDGSFVVIESNGIPNHKSPYFANGSDQYEAYNGTNADFRLNPNRISEQNLVFRIPLNPSEASTKTSTAMGAMGVSVNGIPLFNQYAAGNAPLTNEINSFDQYNGHPQNTGQYHYHIEPLFLTTNRGKSALVGYLLDGFPVYGPEEDGKILTNSDLDDYHGHSHVTPEYPEGVYHYHFTDAAPYLNGGQFFGSPGTVSR